MLRRVKVDKNIERKITIAFITSTSFNKKIRTTYKKEYIELEYAQKIIDWSLQYFDQYTIAPGIHIQDIFDIERPSLKEPLADLIELFLLDISEEYERSELLNVDYLIDQTKSYFRNRALEILFKKGHKLISSGRTEEAERLLTSHKQVSKVTSGRFDPFDPLSIMSYGFSINENELFKFTGDLGDLLGWFERSWLVAVMAPEKRGKCLSGSQRILLSNGTYLPLSQVIEQKIRNIVSFDEVNQKFIKSSVSEFWRNGIKKVYKITTRTGRQVDVTNNHPFLTPNGWKELKDIGKGAFIAVPKKTGKKYLNSEILWDEIIDIQYIGEEETYDLTVDKYHNFVAEDILVHNSWLLEEIVFAALTARLKVFWVSLEMNKTQLQKRTYQKMTGLDAIKSQDCGLPVLDCLNNQDNSCLMKRRTCDCSAPTDLTRNTEYKPCTICKGKSDKYIPAVYHTYLKTNEMKIKLIRDKVKSFSKMYGRNLRIKSYPRFSANIYDVINELDDLEYSENFIPDVIVIDYLDILAYPPGAYKSEREFINTTWKTAAQIAGERNCLVLTADQADAPSRGKRNLDQTSFTDDKRKDAHLDMRIAINQTFDEKERKIARITNLFHRHRYFHPEKEVLILQELSLGQPLLDSVWWNKKFEQKKEE